MLNPSIPSFTVPPRCGILRDASGQQKLTSFAPSEFAKHGLAHAPSVYPNARTDKKPRKGGLTMRKDLSKALCAALFALSAVFAPASSLAADFKREVVYQIITDRFFDGNTANNNPSQ